MMFVDCFGFLILCMFGILFWGGFGGNLGLGRFRGGRGVW